MKRITILAVLSVVAALWFAQVADALQVYYPQDQTTQAPAAPAPATDQYVPPPPSVPAAVDQYVPAVGAEARSQQGATTVSIQDFYFSPAQITVEPGTTVTWVNNGQAPHTVTANDGSFDSGTLQPGQSYSWTFQEAGTSAYYCEIHPSMTGSVTVGAPARQPTYADQLPETGGPSLLLPAAGLLLLVGGSALAFLLRRAS